MAILNKHVTKTVKALCKNLFVHTKRLILRKEALRDAFDGVSHDAGRLKRAATAPSDHHHAAKLVEKGRRAYNEKQYERAEKCFNRAIVHDPQYGLAYTYLGSTYYQMQRIREADMMWAKAIEVNPHSDAAYKAEQRLRRVKATKDAIIADIERTIKGE